MKTYLKDARLIDGTGAPPIDGAALVIEGDTIVHAGRLAAADAPGSDARAVDIAGKTIIPGVRCCKSGRG
jgi:imidazolonepropionase-like amidohydrolase